MSTVWLAKIRRLYDIANVLSSIGLIKKYSHTGKSISKPAYKYTGPAVDMIRDAECKLISSQRANLGLKSVNSCNKHQLNLDDCTPL